MRQANFNDLDIAPFLTTFEAKLQCCVEILHRPRASALEALLQFQPTLKCVSVAAEASFFRSLCLPTESCGEAKVYRLPIQNGLSLMSTTPTLKEGVIGGAQQHASGSHLRPSSNLPSQRVDNLQASISEPDIPTSLHVDALDVSAKHPIRSNGSLIFYDSEMDDLQEELDRGGIAPSKRQTTLRRLQDISDAIDDLPRGLWVDGVVRYKRRNHGGEADIWKGSYAGRTVAIRDFRMPPDMSPNQLAGFRKMIRREILVHRQLRHENILQLIGVTSDDVHPMAIITSWMEQGHSKAYVTAHPEEFMNIVIGSTAGIAYLHEQAPPIIHGDIKPQNILIDEFNRPVLCDFGLSKIRHEITRTFTKTREGGSARHLAPELTSGEPFRITPASDCYALSMTIYELGTKSRPFEHLTSEFAVWRAVLEKKRPPREPLLLDDNLSAEKNVLLWEELERMWSQEPGDRPTIDDVLDRLRRISAPAPLPSEVDVLPSAIPNNAVTSSPGLPLVNRSELETNLSPNTSRKRQRIRRKATIQVPEWLVPPRILLVEDDIVTRRLATKFLQVSGCTIDVAVDGLGAVNKMNLDKHDLVLMDIVMPKLDGMAATHLIRQFDPMTPIISMTSHSNPNEVVQYMSCGMNDILPKPFSLTDLIAILEKHFLRLKRIQQMTVSVPGPSAERMNSPASSNTPSSPQSGPIDHETMNMGLHVADAADGGTQRAEPSRTPPISVQFPEVGPHPPDHAYRQPATLGNLIDISNDVFRGAELDVTAHEARHATIEGVSGVDLNASLPTKPNLQRTREEGDEPTNKRMRVAIAS